MKNLNFLGDLWEILIKDVFDYALEDACVKVVNGKEMFARTTLPNAHKNTLRVLRYCAGQVGWGDV